jgi:hypothetical protein
MLDVSAERVYFYCSPIGKPENAAYQLSTVYLAEGLKALGVPFYSNINYWKVSPDREEYLCRHDPEVTRDDCSIVVMDGVWFMFGNPLPENIFHPKRNYITAYFESAADGKAAWQPEFRQFDFILRSHYNSRFKYPSNFHPWAFGLSDRIIKETTDIPKFEERKSNILVNFRIGHPLRSLIQENFLPFIQNALAVDSSVDNFSDPPTDPYDYLCWQQTGMRHYPSYYKRLRESVACACFGGLFINSWPLDAFGPTKLHDRILNKVLEMISPSPRRVMNWESMRFWEAIAAGCVPFHIDLQKYGASLPMMPENWHHYIGIDLDNIQAAIDRINSEPEILDKISLAGREWALKYYSPESAALRFLETVLK